MTLFEITHGERAAWQRRAAIELVEILKARRDLPIIAWTVGSAGSTLVGNVNGFASADQVRAVFTSWRGALELTESTEFISGGSVFLRAVMQRNGVQVALIATVFGDEHGEPEAGR